MNTTPAGIPAFDPWGGCPLRTRMCSLERAHTFRIRLRIDSSLRGLTGGTPIWASRRLNHHFMPMVTILFVHGVMRLVPPLFDGAVHAHGGRRQLGGPIIFQESKR